MPPLRPPKTPCVQFKSEIRNYRLQNLEQQHAWLGLSTNIAMHLSNSQSFPQHAPTTYSSWIGWGMEKHDTMVSRTCLDWCLHACRLLQCHLLLNLFQQSRPTCCLRPARMFYRFQEALLWSDFAVHHIPGKTPSSLTINVNILDKSNINICVICVIMCLHPWCVTLSLIRQRMQHCLP